MTISLFFHMFLEAEIYVVLCMALFALIMFGLILTDNMDQFMRQQREIANQKASINVLQMRPHFICNTMMSVYCLCKQDPDKAQQVTLDFTSYLRKNFTAIASEDSLFVEFDTPYTQFRLPPLILQPLVENAVKHGMNPDGDPLHISVKTCWIKGGSEIIVENDGSVYDPADDNEPHIALDNIRQRLEMMCRGKLEITPREGGGTSVRVTIPDQAVNQ